jgi:hypothetical protein
MRGMWFGRGSSRSLASKLRCAAYASRNRSSRREDRTRVGLFSRLSMRRVVTLWAAVSLTGPVVIAATASPAGATCFSPAPTGDWIGSWETTNLGTVGMPEVGGGVSSHLEFTGTTSVRGTTLFVTGVDNGLAGTPISGDRSCDSSAGTLDFIQGTYGPPMRPATSPGSSFRTR